MKGKYLLIIVGAFFMKKLGKISMGISSGLFTLKGTRKFRDKSSNRINESAYSCVRILSEAVASFAISYVWKNVYMNRKGIEVSFI